MKRWKGRGRWWLGGCAEAGTGVGSGGGEAAFSGGGGSCGALYISGIKRRGRVGLVYISCLID